jgi:hypothetical protein
MNTTWRSAASIVLCAVAAAQHPQPPAAWSERLADSRRVVDRVVIAFDQASFLDEIARWDGTYYWPVLLWDSETTPVFVRAFDPDQVLFARYGQDPNPNLERGLSAVFDAWGLAVEGSDAAGIAAALRAAGHAPQGAVLVAPESPEFLGGLALAAGRYHLPLVLAPDPSEKLTTRVSQERAHELRDSLRSALGAAGVDYGARFDEVDFITVANGWPFGYTLSEEGSHPGGYTLDDLLARSDDHTRWGWVGRFMGGPERSVYMAMGALFLQPRSGRFWSRYDPNNKVFGQFSPAVALETFDELFPTDAIEHPDTNLDRWRAETWPAGNRHGFLYVNSSGGARGWSVSGGQASYWDLPGAAAGNVATVVHYTHSGSAGAPWDVDSIAGRWMAGGAYIYFGSYAEPYLTAFVSPTRLAERITAGLPLGAAMRLDFDEHYLGAREMEVKGETQRIVFNMSGPWKLAYFGDPSYRLTGRQVERIAPGDLEPLAGKHFTRAAAFASQRVKEPVDARLHHAARVGISLLAEQPQASDRVWKKDLKTIADPGLRAAFTEQAVRVWVGELRAAPPRKRDGKRWLSMPDTLARLLAEGPEAPATGRWVTDLVRSEVQRLDALREAGKDKKATPVQVRHLLELLASMPLSKADGTPTFAWIRKVAERWGIDKKDLRKGSLARDAVSPAVRERIERELPSK